MLRRDTYSCIVPPATIHVFEQSTCSRSVAILHWLCGPFFCVKILNAHPDKVIYDFKISSSLMIFTKFVVSTFLAYTIDIANV